MQVTGEFLDPVAVDRLLVRVHTELQRLNEELHIARRFIEILLPMLTAARGSGTRLRVVDIGWIEIPGTQPGLLRCVGS
jgi:hypothetical protein